MFIHVIIVNTTNTDNGNHDYLCDCIPQPAFFFQKGGL